MNTGQDESSGNKEKGMMKVLTKGSKVDVGLGRGEAEAGNAKV